MAGGGDEALGDAVTIVPASSAPPELRYVLLVVAPGGSIDQHDLPASEPCIVGRSAPAHIQLNDASVSRRHARLLRTPLGFALQDLGSSNGTFVNGDRLGSDPRSVVVGDKIQFANVAAELKQAPMRAQVARRMAEGELDARLDEECDRSLRFGRALAYVTVTATPSGDAENRAYRETLVARQLRAVDLVTTRADGGIDALLTECDKPSALGIGRVL